MKQKREENKMAMSITLDEASLSWLEQNIKKGLSRKQRRMREEVLRQLKARPPKRVEAVEPKRPHGNLGRVRYGTATYDLLATFVRVNHVGLTSVEAASVTSMRYESLRTSCSSLKEKGLLRTDGRRNGRYVYKITSKGRRVFEEARLANQKKEMIGNV